MEAYPPTGARMGAISMPAAERSSWKSYATAPAKFDKMPEEKAWESLQMRARRMAYLNYALQGLFLPWLLFTGLFACRSFEFHFLHPTWCLTVECLCLAVVLGVGAVAWRDRQEKGKVTCRYVPLFLAMAIAWVLAMVLGHLNFNSYLHPFYELQSLNSYPGVDPSQVKGKQVMDGGIVHFVQGSVLNLKWSMGFKNEDVYCVAPITLAGQPSASFDYWAVGKNCCTGDKVGVLSDFTCGQYNNKYARSGLRYMEDADRPFLRLAVQQAVAQYGVTAAHPNFYYWVQDPAAELNGYWETGYRNFCLAMYAYFVLNLLCVAATMVGFSRAGCTPQY